ncbi:phosphoribosylglycinamide synthetase C domain-containing protein, partial [Nocardioides zeicaulis]
PADGDLAAAPEPTFADGAAVSVVLASAGYPETSSKGDVIRGVGRANGVHDVDVIHAGTAVVDAPEEDDPGHRHLVTAGGRVLSVRAVGYDVDDARRRAYAAADLITFEGQQRRSDIAAEPLGVVEGAASRG